MNIGTKVRYQNKLYTVFWVYDSGYCEIKEIDYFHVILAKASELEVVESN
ncbi:hypothetical protein [Alkalihalobacillus sp. BA299]|nr:hypothetical protein [Alkalihalobacillus sp. BA299]